MKLQTALATAGALGLALAPIAAHAAPARASAPQDATSEIGGMSPVLSLLIVMGLIVAVIFVAENEDDDSVSA